MLAIYFIHLTSDNVMFLTSIQTFTKPRQFLGVFNGEQLYILHHTHDRILLIYVKYFHILLPLQLNSVRAGERHCASNPLVTHYGDVIMGTVASQITSLTFVYSAVYSGADLRKHQSSASLVFLRGIHRGPVNSPHKWPVTRKMFPFHDVIMQMVLLARGH